MILEPTEVCQGLAQGLQPAPGPFILEGPIYPLSLQNFYFLPSRMVNIYRVPTSEPHGQSYTLRGRDQGSGGRILRVESCLRNQPNMVPLYPMHLSLDLVLS